MLIPPLDLSFQPPVLTDLIFRRMINLERSSIRRPRVLIQVP
jgi:hypothetical protein